MMIAKRGDLTTVMSLARQGEDKNRRQRTNNKRLLIEKFVEKMG
jgi:hypothetical protein